MKRKRNQGVSYRISEYVRNPEIKRQLAVFVILGGICAAGSRFAAPAALRSRGIVLQEGAEASVWMACFRFLPLAVWAVMGILHFAESYLRYRRLAHLSAELDLRLHTEDIRLLEHMDEGELCIVENEINKLLTRLGEQNRELKKDRQFLADSLTDLSHQLRTPLTSMNLIVSMLESGEPDQQKQFAYFGRLRRLLGKVQWLIEVLLKLSKLDADAIVFERQECGLQSLAAEAVMTVEIPMELKDVAAVTEIAEDAVVYVDRKWTLEAVENIVKNCLEHTPEGGKILISGSQNALYTELLIADTGAGIAKEDLPHIFERFYKGKNSSEESVGIGLALAAAIVTRQGGVLQARNGREGGAEFAMRFYK